MPLNTIDSEYKEKIETVKKYYYVSKGTPYYLNDRTGNLRPITFSISYDGS